MAAENKKNAERERIASRRRKLHAEALEAELKGVTAALDGAVDDAEKARLEGRKSAVAAELKRVKSAGSSRSAQQQTRS